MKLLLDRSVPRVIAGLKDRLVICFRGETVYGEQMIPGTIINHVKIYELEEGDYGFKTGKICVVGEKL